MEAREEPSKNDSATLYPDTLARMRTTILLVLLCREQSLLPQVMDTVSQRWPRLYKTRDEEFQHQNQRRQRRTGQSVHKRTVKWISLFVFVPTWPILSVFS